MGKPLSFQEFAALHATKCACGAYHIDNPMLYAIHEYDRATPERQREMLQEVRDAAKEAK